MIVARHSRALRLGAGASGVSESETAGRLSRSHVVLSVDARIPGAAETAEVLVDTLARRPGRLTLAGAPERIERRLIERIRSIDPDFQVKTAPSLPSDGTIEAHIGTAPDEPHRGNRVRLRALPDNHGAHIASDELLSAKLAPPSALGVMTTGALLAAEIFKHAAGVRTERMTLHQRLSFCPVTLSDDPSRAPVCPDMSVSLAVVGLGAVGTAIAQILNGLPLNGSMLLVDREAFALENLGTYSAGGIADVGRPKVEIAADLLAGFQVTKFHGDINDVPKLIDAHQLPWPRVVLSGLDSIEARHAAQKIWPDDLLDGATGDTVVGLHEVLGPGQPCLQCFLPPRAIPRSSLVELSESSGLTVQQLADGDRPLVPGDLEALSHDQRIRLEAHVGKPICGLAQALGLTSDDQTDQYQPSVPFVSQLAATLAVGRLIARLADPDGVHPNFAQFDALIGPHALNAESRRGCPQCYCAENRTIIETVRTSRRQLLSR
jgi:ThiF family